MQQAENSSSTKTKEGLLEVEDIHKCFLCHSEIKGLEEFNTHREKCMKLMNLETSCAPNLPKLPPLSIPFPIICLSSSSSSRSCSEADVEPTSSLFEDAFIADLRRYEELCGLEKDNLKDSSDGLEGFCKSETCVNEQEELTEVGRDGKEVDMDEVDVVISEIFDGRECISNKSPRTNNSDSGIFTELRIMDKKTDAENLNINSTADDATMVCYSRVDGLIVNFKELWSWPLDHFGYEEVIECQQVNDTEKASRAITYNKRLQLKRTDKVFKTAEDEHGMQIIRPTGLHDQDISKGRKASLSHPLCSSEKAALRDDTAIKGDTDDKTNKLPKKTYCFYAMNRVENVSEKGESKVVKKVNGSPPKAASNVKNGSTEHSNGNNNKSRKSNNGKVKKVHGSKKMKGRLPDHCYTIQIPNHAPENGSSNGSNGEHVQLVSIGAELSVEDKSREPVEETIWTVDTDDVVEEETPYSWQVTGQSGAIQEGVIPSEENGNNLTGECVTPLLSKDNSSITEREEDHMAEGKVSENHGHYNSFTIAVQKTKLSDQIPDTINDKVVLKNLSKQDPNTDSNKSNSASNMTMPTIHTIQMSKKRGKQKKSKLSEKNIEYPENLETGIELNAIADHAPILEAVTSTASVGNDIFTITAKKAKLGDQIPDTINDKVVLKNLSKQDPNTDSNKTNTANNMTMPTIHTIQMSKKREKQKKSKLSEKNIEYPENLETGIKLNAIADHALILEAFTSTASVGNDIFTIAAKKAKLGDQIPDTINDKVVLKNLSKQDPNTDSNKTNTANNMTMPTIHTIQMSKKREKQKKSKLSEKNIEYPENLETGIKLNAIADHAPILEAVTSTASVGNDIFTITAKKAKLGDQIPDTINDKVVLKNLSKQDPNTDSNKTNTANNMTKSTIHTRQMSKKRRKQKKSKSDKMVEYPENLETGIKLNAIADHAPILEAVTSTASVGNDIFTITAKKAKLGDQIPDTINDKVVLKNLSKQDPNIDSNKTNTANNMTMPTIHTIQMSKKREKQKKSKLSEKNIEYPENLETGIKLNAIADHAPILEAVTSTASVGNDIFTIAAKKAKLGDQIPDTINDKVVLKNLSKQDPNTDSNKTNTANNMTKSTIHTRQMSKKRRKQKKSKSDNKIEYPENLETGIKRNAIADHAPILEAVTSTASVGNDIFTITAKKAKLSDQIPDTIKDKVVLKNLSKQDPNTDSNKTNTASNMTKSTIHTRQMSKKRRKQKKSKSEKKIEYPENLETGIKLNAIADHAAILEAFTSRASVGNNFFTITAKKAKLRDQIRDTIKDKVVLKNLSKQDPNTDSNKTNTASNMTMPTIHTRQMSKKRRKQKKSKSDKKVEYPENLETGIKRNAIADHAAILEAFTNRASVGNDFFTITAKKAKLSDQIPGTINDKVVLKNLSKQDPNTYSNKTNTAINMTMPTIHTRQISKKRRKLKKSKSDKKIEYPENLETGIKLNAIADHAAILEAFTSRASVGNNFFTITAKKAKLSGQIPDTVKDKVVLKNLSKLDPNTDSNKTNKANNMTMPTIHTRQMSKKRRKQKKSKSDKKIEYPENLETGIKLNAIADHAPILEAVTSTASVGNDIFTITAKKEKLRDQIHDTINDKAKLATHRKRVAKKGKMRSKLAKETAVLDDTSVIKAGSNTTTVIDDNSNIAFKRIKVSKQTPEINFEQSKTGSTANDRKIKPINNTCDKSPANAVKMMKSSDQIEREVLGKRGKALQHNSSTATHSVVKRMGEMSLESNQEEATCYKPIMLTKLCTVNLGYRCDSVEFLQQQNLKTLPENSNIQMTEVDIASHTSADDASHSIADDTSHSLANNASHSSDNESDVVNYQDIWPDLPSDEESENPEQTDDSSNARNKEIEEPPTEEYAQIQLSCGAWLSLRSPNWQGILSSEIVNKLNLLELTSGVTLNLGATHNGVPQSLIFNSQGHTNTKSGMIRRDYNKPSNKPVCECRKILLETSSPTSSTVAGSSYHSGVNQVRECNGDAEVCKNHTQLPSHLENSSNAGVSLMPSENEWSPNKPTSPPTQSINLTVSNDSQMFSSPGVISNGESRCCTISNVFSCFEATGQTLSNLGQTLTDPLELMAVIADHEVSAFLPDDGMGHSGMLEDESHQMLAGEFHESQDEISVTAEKPNLSDLESFRHLQCQPMDAPKPDANMQEPGDNLKDLIDGRDEVGYEGEDELNLNDTAIRPRRSSRIRTSVSRLVYSVDEVIAKNRRSRSFQRRSLQQKKCTDKEGSKRKTRCNSRGIPPSQSNRQSYGKQSSIRQNGYTSQYELSQDEDPDDSSGPKRRQSLRSRSCIRRASTSSEAYLTNFNPGLEEQSQQSLRRSRRNLWKASEMKLEQSYSLRRVRSLSNIYYFYSSEESDT